MYEFKHLPALRPASLLTKFGIYSNVRTIEVMRKKSDIGAEKKVIAGIRRQQ
jgi:hypothetical protein